MFDPFAYWNRTLATMRVMGATGARLSETADAARVVVEARTRKIGEAVASPLTGDYAELSKMLPEKMSAFGASGNVVLAAVFEAQRACVAEAQAIGTLMLRGGGVPGPFRIAEAAARSGMAALEAFEATSRLGRDALAPVHKTATANARRLRKRGGAR